MEDLDRMTALTQQRVNDVMTWINNVMAVLPVAFGVSTMLVFMWFVFQALREPMDIIFTAGEKAKRKNDESEEKPKRKNDDLELGDDGELVDFPITTGTTLDDLIRQYDQMEDE